VLCVKCDRWWLEGSGTFAVVKVNEILTVAFAEGLTRHVDVVGT
jgi:hypothetical protein